MLFKNTLAQSGGLLVGYFFSFLLAPLMISRLGLDKFGVWAVTGAFATYAGLLDLGVGRSLVRFIAVFDAEGRHERIGQCVGFGLITVTVVGLTALAVVAAIAPILSDQLGVLDTEQMRVVAMASVAIWSFNGYQGVLNVVGQGKRQMVPPNVATMIAVSINFALSVAALLSSSSLVLYALANALAALLGIIPCFIAMRHLWRRPYWARPPRDLIREVLGYSIKDQVGTIADLVNFETDKLVIAFAVDVHSAAIYEIASRVVLGVRGAAILTVSAMIPTAAARIAAEGRQVIGAMYRRYTVRSCSISFPLFMVAAVTAPFLLVAWLGEAPGISAALVSLLTFAYMFHLSTGVGSTIALGAGHPGLVSLNAVLIAILNVALTVALAPPFGVWGVVAGTFLALTIGSFWFSLRFVKLFELSFSDFLGGVVPTGLLSIAVAIPPALLAVFVGAPDSRLLAVAMLAIGVPLYVLPYWFLATRYDLLPSRLRLPRVHRVRSLEAA